ncbi:MAG: D-alanine--D-alanine ligase family protein [Flaviflexus sp.]|nr:D-alanine--D-alanine ligase family protein [Flaviflexus sp.]
MESSLKPRIALVFGGRSGEHDVSRLSAGCVFAAVDTDAYEIVPIGVDREGRWCVRRDHAVDVEDNGALTLPDAELSQGEALELLAGVDVAFPLIHGPLGEDGAFQGLCEMLGVRYVGAGVCSSAVCMDKHVTKTVLVQAGLPVVPWVCVTAAEMEEGRHDDEIAALGLPLFVKPARAGSSLGISKVDSLSELTEAIATAAACDDKILIEAASSGREVECAVLSRKDGPAASDVGEISFSSESGFYDYTSKYVDTDSLELVIPANIPEADRSAMRSMALEAFRVVDGEGMARIDFFYDDGDMTIAEINTIPGFTPFSMYPRLWQQTGLEYSELITELIETARGRDMRVRG